MSDGVSSQSRSLLSSTSFTSPLRQSRAFPMSVLLTRVATQPSIDLTGHNTAIPPSTTPLPFAQEAGLTRDRPPAKKRRVDSSETIQKQSLKACLTTFILPPVQRALWTVSRDESRFKELAVQAVAAVAKTPDIRCRIEETSGALLPGDKARIAERATEVVAQLARLPQFQVRPNEVLPIIRRKLRNHKPQPTTRYRSQAEPPTNVWYSLERKPYLSATQRDDLPTLLASGLPRTEVAKYQLGTVHVDFSEKEVAHIMEICLQHLRVDVPRTREFLARICYVHNVPSVVGDAIPGRSVEDVRNFCSDLLAGRTNRNGQTITLTTEPQAQDRRPKKDYSSRVASLLLAREIDGNSGWRRPNFQNEVLKVNEDRLELIAEFTNCAGDISTISWVSQNSMVCGTTAHSDSHNQQYNKPGNLLLCTVLPTSRLQAFPDHRVPRPRVTNGENSSEAMRRSQDPWLYSSVVSSDYDERQGYTYTSSFDGTVKVWQVTDNTMEVLATWRHKGNVNFVVVSKDGSGRVAAAADTPTEAVRIYTVNPHNIAESPYIALSCSRTDADDSNTWAYFPATMQWGRAPGTQHILAIGYSPRSLTNDDNDIPEEKRKTGEIVLWDAEAGCRIPISNATTANVFEVTWHPTLWRFLVATSPCGLSVDPGIRTQIHMFQPDKERPDGWFAEFQNLDCPASDINEITIMPNSFLHAYVTAACTDGKVYVWDTAQGDRPVHVLSHEDPVDECCGDREYEDTGVKFTAWGTTADRLYTGSSDGVVKVWNVRNARRPYIQKLLEAPGPISYGAFSPNHSKLAIGDATGRVFLFSIDGVGRDESLYTTVPGTARRVRRPRPYTPHPEPPPPPGYEDQDSHSIGLYSRQKYLESQQLRLVPNPVVGAVQGPMYAATGLYRLDAHEDDDPAKPLLADYDRLQRHSIEAGIGSRRKSIRRLKPPPSTGPSLQALHRSNIERDLDITSIDRDDMADLIKASAELVIDFDFDYEETPSSDEL
ncbi:hypothetical protein B0I35DRAFT_372263 [Stachybotrys elegans]|uniref:Target of rapamycin complex subunit LST8 n=1 Tax=Stachybotrys elegans TaxID=80388 RepID=A0A8K0SRY3_9HYPO|nr:hypothetical protein B0I35DRAFT_372263 [Stachybotrys elegans]